MAQKYKHRSPFPLWTLLEGRWVFEMASFYGVRPLLKRLPKGDNHPIIVFPGFMASAGSTRPLRKFLTDLGYTVYDWGQGRNLKFNPEVEAKMLDNLEKTYQKHGQKVSLLGWSLGGVFAREIAKTYPDYVRSVISLGSPITGPRHAALVRPLFELLNGGGPSPKTAVRLEQLHTPPPVPTTSVYSKTDGIVHWHGSVQDDVPHAENIEVYASHAGMGANPMIMYVLADRLAQAEGQWKRFDKSGLKRFFYKSPKYFRRDLGDFY
ncbi:MAG: alpha/beta hydrolase [Hellea sp.]|nr:alpha/beta hydrolase [Hellea sp.]